MAVEYALILKNRAGTTQRVFSDFLALTYRKQINMPGMLQFVVSDQHSAIDYTEQDGQIEVWRWDDANSITAYCDFYGLIGQEDRQQNDNGLSTVTYSCPGQMDFLSRAIVAYPAGVNNRSVFSNIKAETVMKTLVTRNATSSGTTGDGRVRNVDTWGGYISVEADGAGGNAVNVACAWSNLLEALQDVARIGNLDFSLVKTAAQSWEFRTDTTLGDDRSASVIFSPQRGNMRNPRLVRWRLSEKTVAIVGGRGQESERATVTRTGTNYVATYNSKEVFVQATQVSTTAGLNNAGDIRLDELESRDDITWDVIQVPSTLYGKHYFLGDLVTGYYAGVTATKQIDAVTVSVQPSSERVEEIAIETVTP